MWPFFLWITGGVLAVAVIAIKQDARWGKMIFHIEEEVFEKVDNYCVGIVVARGLDNTKPLKSPVLQEVLEQSGKDLAGVNVKQMPEVICFREAFKKVGINPNRYMPSTEALFSRICKGQGLPSISPVVDLSNSVSIKNRIPIGTHDLGTFQDALTVRFTRPGDTFVPFGGEGMEEPDSGEIVFISGHEIRTRRWLWRQSEIGKITEQTTDVFFPIDGFTDVNKDAILQARDELAEELQAYFGCQAETGFVDKNSPGF